MKKLSKRHIPCIGMKCRDELASALEHTIEDSINVSIYPDIKIDGGYGISNSKKRYTITCLISHYNTSKEKALIKSSIQKILGISRISSWRIISNHTEYKYNLNTKAILSLYNKYVIKDKNKYFPSIRELYYENLDTYEQVSYDTGDIPREDKKFCFDLEELIGKYICKLENLPHVDIRFGIDKNNLFSIYFIIGNPCIATRYEKILNNKFRKSLVLLNKPNKYTIGKKHHNDEETVFEFSDLSLETLQKIYVYLKMTNVL